MCPSGRTLTTTAGFRSAFAVIDADRDGKISRDDLRAFYSDLSGPPADENAISLMISAADANKDGFVEYEEFERVLGGGGGGGGGGGVGGVGGEELMEEVFRVMDKDGDGRLSHSDLKSYMQWAGLSASDEDIAAMIALAAGDDDHGQSGVSFQGLLKILAVDHAVFR